MNPTLKTFFSAIWKLCISILRFIVATFYGIVKLLSAVCQLLINGSEEILNHLKP